MPGGDGKPAPAPPPLSLLDLQRADLHEYLPNDILAKADRMSMACSLEARAPFLEHELAEWALGLPPSWKIGWTGELKRLLRLAARETFGPRVADRPKQGFSIPIHSWVRGPLREQVAQLLSPAALAPLEVIDPERVQAVLRQHNSGRRSYGFEIWGLAVLSAWHRARVQNPPAPPAERPLIERTIPWTSP